MRSITSWITLFAVTSMLAIASAAGAKEKPAPPPSDSEPTIQMAILLDTSGSMSGLINQARTQIWKIVNELATAKRDGQVPRLEVALYEYGKSSIPASEGHLRQIVPLSDDLDKISEELFALKTNGGSEYCGQVIQAATQGLTWSEGDAALKLIFIAGNEPFTQGTVDYKTACGEAIAKGITVNTIFCGPHQEGINTKWQDGATLADGSFMSINQNRQVATVKTPYDKKLVELGGKINTTYFAYGDRAKRREAANRQRAQDKNAAKASPAAGATRAAFKGKQQYRAAMDLVDAVENGKVKLADVKEDQLPDEVRKLEPEKRAAFIKTKAAERKKIQDEINELDKKRKEYIAEQRKKESKENTLDEAILKSIREQAQKKQYKFEKN